MGLDLQNFWQQFIFFTDFVAPALSAPEQVICMHAISRTVAVGKAEFSLSLLKLAKLSGFTVLTVQRALARLQERRIIIPAIPEKAKDADNKRVRKIHINTYRVELPTLPLVTLNKVPQRYPHKLLVELGGKAPAIVMADADMGLAVEAVKASRVINSGQVCNCAERVYVQRSVADRFVDKLTAAMKATRFGDPLADESVDYGPLINQAGFRKVDTLVRGAVAAGATITTGGGRGPGEGGYFYQPTVLTGCRQEMEIIRREIFGPVIPVVTFNDLDEAIACANDSDYGLTSSIYTRDLDTALKACREIRFGETYINRENFEAMQGFHAGWRKGKGSASCNPG